MNEFLVHTFNRTHDSLHLPNMAAHDSHDSLHLPNMAAHDSHDSLHLPNMAPHDSQLPSMDSGSSRPENTLRAVAFHVMWVTNTLGLFGNLLLFVVLLRRRILKAHEFLLIALATLDFFHSILNLIQNLLLQKHYSVLFCGFSQIMFHYLLLASCVIIIQITVDRYLAVCHVLYHRIHATAANMTSAILLTQALSLLLVSPSVAICGGQTEAVKRVVRLYVHILQFTTGLVASGTMVVVYSKIARTVSPRSQIPGYSARHSGNFHQTEGNFPAAAAADDSAPSRKTSEEASFRARESSESFLIPRRSQSKSTKTCASISGIYILFSMPSVTVQLMFQVSFRTVLFSDVMIACYILSLWNTIVNPVIYALMYPKYYMDLRQVVHTAFTRLRSALRPRHDSARLSTRDATRTIPPPSIN